jgi:hypothetical protein
MYFSRIVRFLPTFVTVNYNVAKRQQLTGYIRVCHRRSCMLVVTLRGEWVSGSLLGNNRLLDLVGLRDRHIHIY